MPNSPRTPQQARVAFIFVTILIDAIGLGLLVPVLPDVLRRVVSDPTEVSRSFGAFIGVYAFMQFLASPILGSLSDRFGRRPILLCSLLGASLDYAFMAFAPTLPLLFIGRMISGLTGASMTVASSYMADISNDQNRSANFGMIGAAWGVGFILGPMLGGLLGSLGPLAPFFAAAGLNGLNFLFGLLVLPESLPLDRRRPFGLRNFNPFGSVLKILKPSPIVTLVWIYFLLFLAGQIHPVNWTLYTQTKFGWTAREVGFSLTFVGIVMALSQAFLTRSLIPKFGEIRALTVGLAFYAVAYALYGIANSGWMMYAITATMTLSGMSIPALQSILAKRAGDRNQGELQGSLVSLGSFASILAPILFTTLFVEFTKPGATLFFPGAAYLAAAAISLFALIVWWKSEAS